MAKKQTIRLTENELKQIVAESVKKVLSEIRNPNNEVNEGRITNNIPLQPGHKKGEYLSRWNDNDIQKIKDYIKTVPPEKKVEWERFLTYLERNKAGVPQHNQRASKYNSDGTPQFGRDWETSEFIKNKKGREEKLRRGRNEIHP